MTSPCISVSLYEHPLVSSFPCMHLLLMRAPLLLDKHDGQTLLDVDCLTFCWVLISTESLILQLMGILSMHKVCQTVMTVMPVMPLCCPMMHALHVRADLARWWHMFKLFLQPSSFGLLPQPVCSLQPSTTFWERSMSSSRQCLLCNFCCYTSMPLIAHCCWQASIEMTRVWHVAAAIIIWFIAIAFPFFGVINDILEAFIVTFETYIIPCLAFNIQPLWLQEAVTEASARVSKAPLTVSHDPCCLAYPLHGHHTNELFSVCCHL